jgi:hypothetical protein
MWFQQKHPEVWDRIRAVVFDEFDHMLFTLPNWARNRTLDPFGKIAEIILREKDRIVFVGITATNRQPILDKFGRHAHEITFAEPLKQLQPLTKPGNTFEKLEAQLASLHLSNKLPMPGKSKWAIYTSKVSDCLHYKQQLTALGYNVRTIFSDYQTNYTMSPADQCTKAHVELNGRVEDEVDVVVFNATWERGISIHDKRFTMLFIDESNSVVVKQVLGRFRFDGMEWYRLEGHKPKGRTLTELGDEWLGVELDRFQLGAMARGWGIRGSKGEVPGIRGITEKLGEAGIKVESHRKRISGKLEVAYVLTKGRLP